MSPVTLRALSQLALAAGLTAAFTVAGNAYAAAPAASAPPRYVAKDLGWSLKLPAEETVVYQGIANFDNAGMGTGSMLYPAPNIAGFIAALITHGVIVERTRNAQKTRMQEAADRVLLPYKSVLTDYKYRDLMRQALEKTTTSGDKRLAEPSEKPGSDLRIESLPVFSMTQDQTAIVLDNAIVIYAPSTPSTPAYRNIVRVVSRAETAPDIVKHWTDNEGAALKIESARLLAESLDLALGDIAAGFEQARLQRTVRYNEGHTEKMERGEVIREHCGRVVLKNLRGWLMSVAAKPAPDSTSAVCGEKVQKQLLPPETNVPPEPAG